MVNGLPKQWRVFACGDSAITIECALHGVISLEAFESVQSLRRLVESQAITGIREMIPAFTTLTLILNLAELYALTAQPFDYILQRLESLTTSSPSSMDTLVHANASPINIPVCYDEKYAPDLQELAFERGLSVEEVVLLHTEAEYRVAMLGFTPGFPYLLGLPMMLATPRKNSPRANVPAGAVGIAGEQTGIYPLQSPGGWNIIGQTPLRLFMPEAATKYTFESGAQSPSPPTLLKTGDRVRFHAISGEEFEQISTAVSPNIDVYQPSNPTVSILKTGLQAMIQDAGRSGWREYGIPLSGAADVYSYALANILIGNARNDAALEVLPGGFSMRFECETLVALAGADMGAEATYNSLTLRVPTLRPVFMRAGAVLRMNNPQKGLRSYIAFAGGLDTPLSLGSRSTYARAGLGGIDGRALRNGDVIGCGASTPNNDAIMRFFATTNIPTNEISVSPFSATRLTTEPFLAAKWSFRDKILVPDGVTKLRVIRGAEYDELSEASKQALWSEQMCILPNSDRMALRLSLLVHQAFIRATSKQVISRAVMPGTVQLPPDGQPIILLAESQTTGGYPVIAHVCSVDVARAAQARPNDHIVFEEITIEEAQKLYIDRERSLKMLEWRLQSL